jgi:molybdopterin molybdotransferase
VPLAEANARFLTTDLLSPNALPLFDNSAMDGYAVRSTDLAAASASVPAKLRLIGRIEAGQAPKAEVTPGACVRIFTGSAIPSGADAVVMQEDTRTEGENILITEPVKPWENIRFSGEDVKKGGSLASAGEKITSTMLALLAAVGCGEVSVGKRPLVGVLATGSELRTPPAELAPGQIYESNRLMLSTLLSRAGAITKTCPLVPDTFEATFGALQSAFNECDLVVTSGGVSVGEMDFVKNAFERLGGSLEFWKVAIRPGRPFVFGRLENKFLFGLPGNPVSALVTCLLLVCPAVLKWQGARDVQLRAVPGVLGEALTNDGARRHFVRVRIDQHGKVFSAGIQASHILSALAAANGLVDLPPRATLQPGQPIRVMTWDAY